MTNKPHPLFGISLTVLRGLGVSSLFRTFPRGQRQGRVGSPRWVELSISKVRTAALASRLKGEHVNHSVSPGDRGSCFSMVFFHALE